MSAKIDNTGMGSFLKRRVLSVLLLFVCMSGSAEAGQSEALLMRGVAKTLSAAFSIPAGIVNGASQNGFPFGMVTGALQGTVSAVGKAVGGAVDLARGGAPYAKYAALAA